ncbi:hypothetical protein L3X38_027143 [Prunus dulcis]|uniref:Uncharacterized protein n=1 Tax=Prunus dulcis TaxID=3755 RepID=A0AAD4VP76_PRUDU|nr:hypothetical protein L3X38_027143 [Prunus dulcis]
MMQAPGTPRDQPPRGPPKLEQWQQMPTEPGGSELGAVVIDLPPQMTEKREAGWAAGSSAAGEGREATVATAGSTATARRPRNERRWLR